MQDCFIVIRVTYFKWIILKCAINTELWFNIIWVINCNCNRFILDIVFKGDKRQVCYISKFLTILIRKWFILLYASRNTKIKYLSASNKYIISIRNNEWNVSLTKIARFRFYTDVICFIEETFINKNVFIFDDFSESLVTLVLSE